MRCSWRAALFACAALVAFALAALAALAAYEALPRSGEMERYVDAWRTPSSSRCGSPACEWIAGFGPIDVGCVFSIGRGGLSANESAVDPPEISFRLADGTRFSVELGVDAAAERFVDRPVLCEYAGAADSGSDLASLATANSARYLFRLWPQFLNRLLYFTEVGVRSFLWIGELPPSLGRATAPECLQSRPMRLFESREGKRRRLKVVKSFYDGAPGAASPERGETGNDVSYVSNHMLKIPAAIATLRHPTVEGVALLDLDSVAPRPWAAPEATLEIHRGGAHDIVFPSSKRLNETFPCWRVKSSHFYARHSAFALAFFSTWFTNRCSFKDQYSLWHTLLQFASKAGCLPYDGDIYRSYEYWDAIAVEKTFRNGSYPAGINLTCDRIRRFCPTFPVDLGARDCVPTTLLDAFHHHSVDTLRIFPVRGSQRFGFGDMPLDFPVVDSRFADTKASLSNHDYLGRLGLLPHSLGRRQWPPV